MHNLNTLARPTILVARCAVYDRHPCERDARVLAVLRQLQARHNPMLWEIPGGKAEPGETAAAAAIREVEEETDLAVKILSAGRILEDRIISDDSEKQGNRHLKIGFTAVVLGGELRLSDEVAAAEWQTPQDLREYRPLTPVTLAALKPFSPTDLLQWSHEGLNIHEDYQWGNPLLQDLRG